MDLQAIARVHRYGQTRPVRVIRLVAADTVEEVILHRALRKLRLARDVLAAPEDAEGGEGAAPNAPASSDSLLQVLKHGLGTIGIDAADAANGAGSGSRPPPPKATATEAAQAALSDAEVDAVLQRLGDAAANPSPAAASAAAPVAAAPSPPVDDAGEGGGVSPAPAQGSEAEEPQTITQDDLLHMTSTQGSMYRFGDTQYNAKGEAEAAPAQTGSVPAPTGSGDDDDEALRSLMRLGSQRRAQKKRQRAPLTAEEKAERDRRCVAAGRAPCPPPRCAASLCAGPTLCPPGALSAQRSDGASARSAVAGR